MIKILLIMFAGMACGMLFRNRKTLVRINNKAIIWVIFLLLFFMGVSVGKNSEIMDNLHTIGLRGLQLSLAAVLGSVLLSWIVYRSFFKNNKNHNVNTNNKHEG